jgi:hypothetical protein
MIPNAVAIRGDHVMTQQRYSNVDYKTHATVCYLVLRELGARAKLARRWFCSGRRFGYERTNLYARVRHSTGRHGYASGKHRHSADRKHKPPDHAGCSCQPRLYSEQLYSRNQCSGKHNTRLYDSEWNHSRNDDSK